MRRDVILRDKTSHQLPERFIMIVNACKIMLDISPKRLAEQSAKHGIDFWQLRTPLTNYALSGRPYGLDNGCFKRFDRKAWERLLREAHVHRPVFVCLPDIVGDARRTLDLFEAFRPQTNGLPRALVLQDGIGQFAIPWEHLSAVFVGGSDAFKTSTEARNACRCARMLGKWVHVGRVNTPSRARYWRDIADSIDGSGISRDLRNEQLASVVSAIYGDSDNRQLSFFEG